jgi:outer membrane receptor protein involved in Fe transport
VTPGPPRAANRIDEFRVAGVFTMQIRMLLGAASTLAVCAALADGAVAQTSLPNVTVDAPAARQQVKPARASRAKPAPRRPVRSTRSRAPSPATPVPVAGGAGTQASGNPEPRAPGMGSVSRSVNAQPAHTTIVSSEEIKALPVTTYGDIFRPIAGFNISNYSQGVIGYGLTLRGFTDGEHGRDVAYFIDGVPVNEVSSQHTPNYADLNPLIPETVDHIDVIRGPFSVEYGNSNLGGSVNIVTKTAEPYATAGVSGGSFGTLRGIGTYSTTQGQILPYLAVEGFRTNGYAQNNDVERGNIFAKGTTTLEGGGELSVRAQVYKADGGAPGYISRDLLNRGLISDKTATDQTDGSTKFMQNLVANYRIGPAGQEFQGTLYVNHDTFDRWANFGGGQRDQNEERTTSGATAKKYWTLDVSGVQTQLLVGGDWRTDFIHATQAPSVARVANMALAVRNMDIRQTDLAAYSQLQVKPTEWLKLTGGVRFDQFFYDVQNYLTPAVSPSANLGVASPKAGISITPVRWAEIYANYGQGFRSPSAVDDLATLATAKPTKLTSKEAGVRLNFDRVSFTADVWRADNSNEMYQAAPGLPVLSLGQSRKQGVDLEGKVTAYRDDMRQLAIFANYSPTSARLINSGASIYVPSVPQSLLNIGLDYDQRIGNGDKLTATAYVTFVGKKYLTQDGLQTTKPYSRVSAKVGYAWRSGWDAFAQATWYPGDRYSEAAFNFGDNVGAAPTDIYVRPVPRLTLMAGASYKFATSQPPLQPVASRY